MVSRSKMLFFVQHSELSVKSICELLTLLLILIIMPFWYLRKKQQQQQQSQLLMQQQKQSTKLYQQQQLLFALPNTLHTTIITLLIVQQLATTIQWVYCADNISDDMLLPDAVAASSADDSTIDMIITAAASAAAEFSQPRVSGSNDNMTAANTEAIYIQQQQQQQKQQQQQRIAGKSSSKVKSSNKNFSSSLSSSSNSRSRSSSTIMQGLSLALGVTLTTTTTTTTTSILTTTRTTSPLRKHSETQSHQVVAEEPLNLSLKPNDNIEATEYVESIMGSGGYINKAKTMSTNKNTSRNLYNNGSSEMPISAAAAAAASTSSALATSTAALLANASAASLAVATVVLKAAADTTANEAVDEHNIIRFINRDNILKYNNNNNNNNKNVAKQNAEMFINKNNNSHNNHSATLSSSSANAVVEMTDNDNNNINNNINNKFNRCLSCQMREKVKHDSLESIKTNILMRLQLSELPNITAPIIVPDNILENFYKNYNVTTNRRCQAKQKQNQSQYKKTNHQATTTTATTTAAAAATHEQHQKGLYSKDVKKIDNTVAIGEQQQQQQRQQYQHFNNNNNNNIHNKKQQKLYNQYTEQHYHQQQQQQQQQQQHVAAQWQYQQENVPKINANFKNNKYIINAAPNDNNNDDDDDDMQNDEAATSSIQFQQIFAQLQQPQQQQQQQQQNIYSNQLINNNNDDNNYKHEHNQYVLDIADDVMNNDESDYDSDFDDDNDNDNEDEFYSRVNSMYVFPTAQRMRQARKVDILQFKFESNYATILRSIMHIYIRGRDWIRNYDASLLEHKNVDGTIEGRRNIVLTVHRAIRRTNSLNYTHTIKLTEARHEIPAGLGQWIQIEVNDLSKHWMENRNATQSIIVKGLEPWMYPFIVTDDESMDNRQLTVHIEVLTKDKSRQKRSTSLDCQESDHEVRCCRYPLKVNFTTFGWHFVVAPTSFDAYFCNGECKVGYLEQYTHTHIASLTTSATPCCSPTKMSSLSLLYFNLDHHLVLSTIPNMSVEKCSSSAK